MRSPFRTLALTALAVALAGTTLRADEGMWTFNNLPVKQLKAKYGWAPDQAWLDHLRLSALRFPGGSGSFVSADGLVLTNHHVGRGWIQRVSDKDHDYVTTGFYAPTQAQEIKVPGLEVLTLMAMDNVTDRVNKAVKPGMTDAAALKAREVEIEKIKQEMQEKTGLTCEYVSLYQGGQHWIYSYQKHTDVRLVFAPEQQIAFFGGDYDNFTYPRHDLDFSMFRVYENGKPYHPKDYLHWTKAGVKAGELALVAGHPGRTSRQETLAQMSFEGEYAIPMRLTLLESMRKDLTEYASRSAEAARQVNTQIFGIENSLKALNGYRSGLSDKAAMARIAASEKELKEKVAKDPKLTAEAGQSWARIAKALAVEKPLLKEGMYVGTAHSTLLGYALTLVRLAEEEGKPSAKRLPEFSDANLKATRMRLAIPAPFYPELETFMFTRGLAEARKALGPQHPYVKAMLGGKSPEAVAQAAVEGSKLADPAVRKALMAGGLKAIDASTDPMILLARKLDPIGRKLRKQMEDQVASVISDQAARLARARFALYGTSTYPDATFTLRLAFGPVEGYPANGTLIQPFTTFGGLFDRYDGWGGNAAKAHNGAWELPQRWVDHRKDLDPSTPFDFVCSADIIGGNSGSPVVDEKGDLVGLIFDGNIESLPGNYFYDGTVNRAVAVDALAIPEALRKVYGATALADELTGK